MLRSAEKNRKQENKKKIETTFLQKQTVSLSLKMKLSSFFLTSSSNVLAIILLLGGGGGRGKPLVMAHPSSHPHHDRMSRHLVLNNVANTDVIMIAEAETTEGPFDEEAHLTSHDLPLTRN